MQAEEFSQHLEKVRKSGCGFMALCPAHDDRNPSLSFRDSDDRKKLLLYCHAGCSTQKIMAAIDHNIKELFNE